MRYDLAFTPDQDKIMLKTECPCCKKETITLKQKLLANKWIDIYCSECGERFCAQPILLAVMSFILTWNVIYFGYLTIKQEEMIYPILFMSGWVLIEFFMFYIPLARLRPKPAADTSSD